jgi:hypothetical protein
MSVMMVQSSQNAPMAMSDNLVVAPQGRFEIFYEPAKSAFKGGGVLRRLRQAPFAHFRSEIELATREA